MLLAEPLINYLRQLERQGQTHVHIDDRANKILRAFYLQALENKKAPKKLSPSPQTAKATAPTHSNIPTTTAQYTPIAGTEVDALSNFRDQLIAADLPKTLRSLRSQLVFSSGRLNPEIMFVGESPGQIDEENNFPLSGPAGNKLNAILATMGLSRDSVYLTNLVKYRPAMPNQTISNRRPHDAEIAASLPWLEAEIAIVKPKIIVALGSVVAATLTGNSTASIDELRGHFHSFHNIPLRVSYPPSYLLLHEENGDKRKVWEDMLAIMEHINLPISERQRGYFLPKF